MLPPKSGGAPKQLMVLLHGYGADGADLLGLGWEWRDLWPEMLFVAPNAPDPYARNPAGYQWFDLEGDPLTFRKDGADKVRPVIVNFLIDLWAQTGLSARDTVLCGFSQGAMMALNVGTSLDREVAAIVSFSGLLIPPDAYTAKPPVALIHGEFDPVVAPQFSVDAETVLRAEGFSVERHLSPGLGHGIAPDGIAFSIDFLRKQTALKA